MVRHSSNETNNPMLDIFWNIKGLTSFYWNRVVVFIYIAIK